MSRRFLALVLGTRAHSCSPISCQMKSVEEIHIRYHMHDTAVAMRAANREGSVNTS